MKNNNKKNNVLVAIPSANGMVDVEYLESILALGLRTRCDIRHMCGSLVYAARNKFVEIAIEENYEYVLFVDSDMVFLPESLEILMSYKKDIVSGSIFSRVAPYRACSYKSLKLATPDNIVCEPCDVIGDGLQEVEGVGTAFLLIKVKVFKDIIDKYKQYPFQPIPGYGEDLSFCLRARGCGYKIYVDNDLTIGHIGKVVVTREIYEKQQKEKDK